MEAVDPGSQLLDLIKDSPSRLVMVAPFIKTAALARVLHTLDPQDVHIDCVTRWHPADIADGVCDLEIFEQLNALPHGTLWIRHDLHAKYFRADNSCLVGSANLTGRAFGWRVPANLELMVTLSSDFPNLSAWEEALFKSSIRATADLRDRVAAQAREFIESASPRKSHDVENAESPDNRWVPLCARPDLLYHVYTGNKNEDDMLTSTFTYAQRDLATLGLPSGLPEPTFNLFIADALRKLLVIQDVIGATKAGISDQNALQIIGLYHHSDHEVSLDAAWSNLKLWMLHFFPDEFRIEARQEVLVRGRQY